MSPVFGQGGKGFLEGLFHVAEVARSHPAYDKSLLHQAVVTDEPEKGEWLFCNMILYNPVEEGIIGLYAKQNDYMDAIEYGVPDAHHAVLANEIAVFPEGTGSALRADSAAVVTDEDLVAFAAFKVGGAGDEADWETWSGVQKIQEHPSFRSAALYKCGGPVEIFQYVLRVMFSGPLDDQARVALFADLRSAIPGDAADVQAGLYEIMFEIPKDGSPVGVIAGKKTAADVASGKIKKEDLEQDE